MWIWLIAFLCVLCSGQVDGVAFASDSLSVPTLVPFTLTGVQAPSTLTQSQPLSTDELLRRLDDLTKRVSEEGQASDILKQRLDDQEKMISMGLTSGSLDAGRLGVLLAILGALITFVVIFFGLRADAAARMVAHDVARKEMESTENKFRKIEGDCLVVRNDILSYKDKASCHASEVLGHVEEIRRIRDSIMLMGTDARRSYNDINFILRSLPHSLLMTRPEHVHSSPIGVNGCLHESVVDAANIPDGEKSFQDWSLIGLSAHDCGNVSEALSAFERAEDLAPDVLSRAVVMNCRAKAMWDFDIREGAVSIWQRIIQSYSKYANGNSDFDAIVAKALANKAYSLAENGNEDDAIITYRQLESRIRDSTEKEIRVLFAGALCNMGYHLAKFGRASDALDAYNNVATRYKDESDGEICKIVAMCLYNKGVTLVELGQMDESIAAYDDVVMRYEGVTELGVRVYVARALFNKGVVLASIGEKRKAIAAYDEVQVRFLCHADVEIRTQVARALFNKGVILFDLGLKEDAITTYEAVDGYFKEVSDREIRLVTAKALRNKAIANGYLGRVDMARDMFNDLITRYDMVEDGELQELVDDTRKSLKKMM